MGFFFLPALVVGKHSFIRFSCRVARAPGTLEQLLYIDTVSEMSQSVFPSCSNCLAAALWFEVPILFPGMSELSFSSWNSTWPSFLYFLLLSANSEGFLLFWAQVLFYSMFSALKIGEVLIPQIPCHAGKQHASFSLQ